MEKLQCYRNLCASAKCVNVAKQESNSFSVQWNRISAPTCRGSDLFTLVFWSRLGSFKRVSMRQNEKCNDFSHHCLIGLHHRRCILYPSSCFKFNLNLEDQKFGAHGKNMIWVMKTCCRSANILQIDFKELGFRNNLAGPRRVFEPSIFSVKITILCVFPKFVAN